MHPIILFNHHRPEEYERTKRAGADILEYCISVGGSITGEHGVGMEKNEMMPLLFPAGSLEMIGRLKNVFNPDNRLNPGKLLPTGKGCMEVRPSVLTTQRMDW